MPGARRTFAACLYLTQLPQSIGHITLPTRLRLSTINSPLATSFRRAAPASNQPFGQSDAGASAEETLGGGVLRILNILIVVAAVAACPQGIGHARQQAVHRERLLDVLVWCAHCRHA
jgi:hypothetical protein